MPKRVKHILPSGATYSFTEYGINDLVDCKDIRAHLSKEVMSTYIDPYAVGRKLDKMASHVGKVIVRDMFTYIVDRLMQSDRLILPYGKEMYIGHIPHNPKRIAKKWKLHELNLHSGGKRFGVRMDGTKENYYFRMPKRRRKELRQRIMDGQWFIGRI
jgi:hypothetical protein